MRGRRAKLSYLIEEKKNRTCKYKINFAFTSNWTLKILHVEEGRNANKPLQHLYNHKQG